MSNLTLTVEDDAPPEDVQLIRDQLIAYNRARAEDPRWNRLNLFVRDETRKIHGGLVGEIYFGWLFVALLWIEEPLRRHGWGGRLLRRAEEEAAARGCHSAWLDTFSFQAPEYYQRHGYEVFGRLDDYPPGQTRFFLRKRLEPAS